MFEEVREDGKDEKEGFRLRVLLPLVVVPLVEGRYERTEVMINTGSIHCQRQIVYQFGQGPHQELAPSYVTQISAIMPPTMAEGFQIRTSSRIYIPIPCT